MKMDRKLREDLIAAAERGAYLAMMRANEQYLTADELCKQFQMFTKDWLEKYGDILPRKQLRVEAPSAARREEHAGAMRRWRLRRTFAMVCMMI